MLFVGNKTALLELLTSVKMRTAILFVPEIYQFSPNSDFCLLIKLTSDFQLSQET